MKYQFKGKRTGSDEWVTGDLTNGDTIHIKSPYVDSDGMVVWMGISVDPATVELITPPTSSIQPMTWEQAKDKIAGTYKIGDDNYKSWAQMYIVLARQSRYEAIELRLDQARELWHDTNTAALRREVEDCTIQLNACRKGGGKNIEVLANERDAAWIRIKQLEGTLDPSFIEYMNETRRSFVSKTVSLFPHENKPNDKRAADAWTIGRVAAEDMLICFDQMREKITAAAALQGEKGQ